MRMVHLAVFSSVQCYLHGIAVTKQLCRNSDVDNSLMQHKIREEDNRLKSDPILL